MKKTEMVYALEKGDSIANMLMKVALTGEEDREDKAAEDNLMTCEYAKLLEAR